MDWQQELEDHVNRVAYEEVNEHNGHNRHNRHNRHEHHHGHGHSYRREAQNHDGLVNALLFLAILGLVALIVFILVKEKGFYISPPLANQPAASHPEPVIPPPPTAPQVLPPIPQQQLPENENPDSLVDWNTEKLTLLAMIFNHNIAVSKLNQHRSRYILINPDWTIDSMPDNLELTPKDREFLQQYLRK